jgi:hypothetical protein
MEGKRGRIRRVIKPLNYSVAVLILWAASAFARIGETERQIEARYGKPTQTFRATKAYFYKDFFIVVAFDNGKSGIEVYQKRNASPMTAVEIGTLLDTNGGGTKWHQPTPQRF